MIYFELKEQQKELLLSKFYCYLIHTHIIHHHSGDLVHRSSEITDNTIKTSGVQMEYHVLQLIYLDCK